MDSKLTISIWFGIGLFVGYLIGAAVEARRNKTTALSPAKASTNDWRDHIIAEHIQRWGINSDTVTNTWVSEDAREVKLYTKTGIFTWIDDRTNLTKSTAPRP